MTDRLLPPNRRPIVIADSRLRAGTRSASIAADDPEALLRQYLRLIRRVRKQQRHRSVALRRADLTALAVHLGWTDDEVLARLADLMGATRRQRATMLAVLATGASLITITGPATATAGPATDEPGVGHHEAPVVVLADHLTTGRATTPNEHAGRLTGPDADAPAGRQAPVLAAKTRRTTAPAPSLYVGQVLNSWAAPQAQQRVDETAPDAAPDEVPDIETGIDELGNLVATGPPPVPPVAPATDTDPEPDIGIETGIETGIDELGNLVATGPPPVPPVAPATDTDTDTDTDTAAPVGDD